MAHIYRSYNNLQKKYDALRNSRMRLSRTLLRYAALLISTFFMLVCGWLLFSLLLNPDTSNAAESIISDWILKWILAPLSYLNNVFSLEEMPDEFLLRIPFVAVWYLTAIPSLLIYMFISEIALGLAYILPILILLYSVKLFMRALNQNKWYIPPSDMEEVLRVGIEGERAALDIMSALNDHCHVFANVIVPNKNSVSETDLIIVSPTSITIVEVKNKSGRFFGDLSDDELIQAKTLRNGNTIEKPFYNPVHQVRKHMLNLTGYLRSNGINVRVQTSVLFVNKSASFHLTDCQNVKESCPVYSRQDSKLLLSSLCTGKPINPENTARAVTLIKQLIK